MAAVAQSRYPIMLAGSLLILSGLFGPRDRSFTLIGIVIDRTPGNLPQLWFPDSGIPPGDVEGRSKACGDPAEPKCAY